MPPPRSRDIRGAAANAGEPSTALHDAAPTAAKSSTHVTLESRLHPIIITQVKGGDLTAPEFALVE